MTNVTYESFDEFSIKWGQRLRRLDRGESFLQLVNDPRIRNVKVDYLPFELTAELQRRIDELLEQNYESDFFITQAEADRERDECRQWLLTSPTVRLPDQTVIDADATESKPAEEKDPFR